MKDVNIKLKVACKEIESIMRKHDIGGFVVLADGEGCSEFRLFIDTPTWSTIKFKKPHGIHIKAYGKSLPRETNMTVNLVVICQDLMGHLFLMLDRVHKQLKSTLNIEYGEPGPIIPHNDEDDPA